MKNSVLGYCCLVVAGLAIANSWFPATALAGSGSAYSSESVHNFKITGGDATTPEVFASNRASFTGFGMDEQTGTINALQAKSGVGPFPVENQFSSNPPLVGARADSKIGAFSPGEFDGAESVAQASRATPGSAEGYAFVLIRFDVTQVGNNPVTIAFDAAPFLQIAATPTATAFAGLSFEVVLRDATTNNALLTWTPNGDPLTSFQIDGGSVSDVVEPFGLNKSITTGNGTDLNFRLLDHFSLSYRRAPGQAYKASVEISNYASVEVSVPEPASWSLAAGGFVGIAVVAVRRRSRARR